MMSLNTPITESERLNDVVRWNEGSVSTQSTSYRGSRAVAGQVTANRIVNETSTAFPSEAELSSEVRAFLPEVRGEILAQGTELVPCIERGKLIKVIIARGRRRLSFSRDTPLKTANGNAYAGGAWIREATKIVTSQFMFHLYGSDGKPIALCVEGRLMLNAVFTIYGTRPLVPDNKAPIIEGGVAFYPWFRVDDFNGSGFLLSRPIMAWNGTEFTQFLKAVPSGSDWLFKKTDFLITNTVDDLELGYCSHFKSPESRSHGLQTEVTIAPGVDPAMMICIAAILDRRASRFL